MVTEKEILIYDLAEHTPEYQATRADIAHHTLPALVHPFYQQSTPQNSGEQIRTTVFEKVAQALSDSGLRYPSPTQNSSVFSISEAGYYFRLQRFLKNHTDRPLLLIEEVPFVQSSLALLRALGHSGPQIVSLSKTTSPAPLDGDWERLAQTLFSLQAERILVMGQLSVFLPEVSDEPRGCVPSFRAALQDEKKKIKTPTHVQTTPLVFPNIWVR